MKVKQDKEDVSGSDCTLYLLSHHWAHYQVRGALGAVAGDRRSWVDPGAVCSHLINFMEISTFMPQVTQSCPIRVLRELAFCEH